MIKKNKQLLLCAPRGGVVGGITKWTEHVMKYYADNGIKSELEIKLYSTSRKNSVHSTSKLIYRIFSGIIDYIPVINDFNKLIKSGNYDIVHITSGASLGLFRDLIMLKRARFYGSKSVIHFHFGKIPELYLKKNWEQKLLNKVIKLADKAVVIDQKSYDTLIHEGYTNIELLPNPLAPEILKIIENNKDIKRVNNKIVFAGHVVPTKGVFELVEACKDIPNINVKMLGYVTNEMKNKLDELAGRGNDWLTITGELDFESTIREMLSAGIFVLPTYTEGFPNVILESMACGCPIVASAVGAIPEMLNINGEKKCGICTEPKNIQQLKNTILKMLDNRDFALECGLNARNRVNDKYNMTVVWNQMYNIWKSLSIKI